MLPPVMATCSIYPNDPDVMDHFKANEYTVACIMVEMSKGNKKRSRHAICNDTLMNGPMASIKRTCNGSLLQDDNLMSKTMPINENEILNSIATMCGNRATQAQICETIDSLLSRGAKIKDDSIRILVSNGLVRVINHIVEQYGVIIKPQFFYDAVCAGNLSMIECLYTYCDIIPSGCIEFAIKYESREIISWLFSHGSPTFSRTSCMEVASCANNLELMKWLAETWKCQIDLRVLENAIQFMNIRMIEWLVRVFKIPITYDIVNYCSTMLYCDKKVFSLLSNLAEKNGSAKQHCK